MAELSLPKTVGVRDPFTPLPTENLRQSTIRGGMVTSVAQGARFLLQIGSTMVLARLLSPSDFGLVAMVTVLTGFLNVFGDGGLAAATVQRATVTRAQVSNLFWIGCGLGGISSLVALVSAPLLVRTFHEPRLLGIAFALSIPFLLNALTVQHKALLTRQMRFNALAVIEIVSLVVGNGVAIVMATNGFGYWALVGMPIAVAVVNLIALAAAAPWLPGRPRRSTGVRPMLRFGGFLTGSQLLNHVFRNADNALIGWWWGAGPLGLYTKAYSLLMLPISQVNLPLSGVAVPALSRLQDDSARFRRTFRGGYSIVATAILPAVATLAILADEVIIVVLGPQWQPAVHLFRLLAPAALLGGLLNPFSWLFLSTGRTDRQLRFGFLWCALMVGAFAAGLRFGPAGVAAGYSLMSCALALPLCVYALRGTSIRLSDLFNAVKFPALATVAAGLAGIALLLALPQTLPPIVRAGSGGAAFLGTYSFVLLVLLKQWPFYRDLLAQLFPKKSA